MSRTSLAALIGLLSGPAVAAEAAAPLLTLHDAVEVALENNHRLDIADAVREVAEASLDGARARRRPRADLIESFSWTTNPALVFTHKLGQEVFGPEDFDPDRLNNPDDLTNFNTMLSAGYTVYAGGRLQQEIEVARHSHDAATADRERTRQEVVHEVLDSFSAAILADSRLRVAEDTLSTARAHVDLVSNLFEAGLVVESDLLQARVRQSEVEEMVVRAASALEVARAALNLSLGRELDVPFVLPTQIESVDSGDPPLDEMVEEASRKRTDLASAEARLRAAERSERLERSGIRPEVNLEGRYEANAEEFIGADGTNWSVFFAARIPVFDGKRTRARVTRAQAQVRVARAELELLRRSVELDVRRAFHEMRAARAGLEQSLGAVELARESLRIVQDRYGEGLTTLVELLEAEATLTRARTRVVGAERQLLLSRASLDLARGRL